jgi:hypothetical protein
MWYLIINLDIDEANPQAIKGMSYKNYWQDIVDKYRVYIEGWPDGILFRNLATSLPALEKLCSSWKSG